MGQELVADFGKSVLWVALTRPFTVVREVLQFRFLPKVSIPLPSSGPELAGCVFPLLMGGGGWFDCTPKAVTQATFSLYFIKRGVRVVPCKDEINPCFSVGSFLPALLVSTGALRL